MNLSTCSNPKSTCWQRLSAYLVLVVSLFCFSFNQTSSLNAQCPTIFIDDMNGIPGYPEANDMSVCGVPDTLTYYVSNTSGTTLLNSEFVLHIPPGLQYGGFALAFDPNYSIMEGDVSDLQNPTFVFANIGADSVQIINIAVQANCDIYDLPPTQSFKFDADFNFLYAPDPFTAPIPCTVSKDGSVEYSPFITRPTITITQQSLPSVVITNGNRKCNNVTVTQTGIGATVTGFNFTIDGIDLTNFGLNELSIGGVDLPYNYDATGQLLSAYVDPSYLPNGFLGEDEGVIVRVCYDAPMVCDTEQGQSNLLYGSSFGCSPEEPPCVDPSTVDGTIEYKPNFASNADVSVSTVQLPAICGDNAIFEVTAKSTNTDPVLGLWEDLQLGFQICEADAFDAADVRINGVSLPVGSYYFEGFDFVVDATTFTSDPDGPGVGFEDVDGDGIFDDLPGGNQVTMQIEAAIKCQNPEQIAGCAAIDCSFQQATITGLRHCGQAFQATPQISPAPVFSYGADTIGTNQADISPNQDGSILGFDFMTGTGSSQANTSTNTVDIEFCYEFGTEGVGPCENGETYFEVAVSGPKVMTTDLEILEASVTFQGNAVPAGDISSYYNVDSSEIVFRILAGSNDAGMQCYNLSLELDSCLCYPQQYASTSLRVVENCFDCNGPDGNPCTIVRACEETLLASRRSCNCICPMSDEIVEIRRTNFGYSDKSMTTKLDKNTVDPADWNRYLPCDSMYIHVEYEVLDELTVADYDWIRFQILGRATAGASMNPAREVIPDFTHTQIQEFSFEKVSATGVRTPIDLSSLDCTSGNAADYANLNDGYLDALGFEPVNSANTLINGRSVYNQSYDVLDNERFYIDIEDKDRQAERGRDQGLSGNCWEYVRETLMGGLEKGDKFHLIAIIPMQKNPYRQLIPDVAATPPAAQYIRSQAVFYSTVAGTNTFNRATCGSNFIYDTHCPGPISASTEYNIDDCSATVEHTFTMANTPADWYVNEYRPEIMEFDTLLVPIPSPLIYAGNAEVIFNGDTTAITDPDFDNNTTCVFDSDLGQDLCTSNAGTTAYGSIDVSAIPMFGVGLPGGEPCELKIRYDLARICPGVIPSPENFELYYDYSLSCDFNPGGNYCGITAQAPNGSNGFLNNDINYLVEDCRGTSAAHRSNMLFDARDYHLTEDTSFTLVFNDNSSALPPLTSSVTSTLLADAAGASEFNTYEVCAGAGAIPHTNVMTTVTLEPTVDLINMTSAAPGFTFTEVSSDASGTTYLIELAELQPNTCFEFEIETELIICPYPGVGTMTCIKTTSSCLDLEIAAQLFASGGEACTATESCYEYVAGETEIQAEWEPPAGAVALCSTNEFVVRVKNTKIATLVDLEFNFNLPAGLDIIPNSFEYEYPEGSGNWVSISDPVSNGANAFGPLFSMTDDDMVADIDPNGLPGILDDSAENSNLLSIRFDAKTICDEYTSNTPLYFESTAADPCESRISSGFTKNDGLVVANAVPSDNAQFLLVADPLKYTCGGPVPVSISGTNLSSTGGETYMSEACFKFPSSLAYTMGSFNFTAPSSWAPTYVTETVLPGGFTQVCFDLPDGIKPLEIFAFDVELTPDPMAMCEELSFGADVKSLVEDQICIGDDNIEGTGDDTTCDVFVNNAINDQIVIQIAPPAEIADLNVTVACDNDPTVTTYNYTLDLEGVSTTDYSGDVIVDWYRDLNLNGVFDDGIDPLLASETLTANVPSGGIESLTGSVTMPEAFSCPVIVKTTLDIACDCAGDEFYMDKAPTPEFVAQFDGPVQLCPGDDFNIAICSGFDFEVIGNATLTETATDLTVSIAPGAGVNSPIILEATTQQGQCSEETFQIEIYQLESFDLGPFEAMEMCNMECTELDLAVPADWIGNMTVSWSPVDYLDNPTSFNPMICNPAADITYTVTITNPNSGCTTDAMFPVTVKEATPATITYEGYEDCFLPYDPAKLIVTPAGMANYKFYYVDTSGVNPDVLFQNGSSNEFTLPFAQGKFYAVMNDGMCDTPTDTICLDIKTCIFDLALTKVMSPTQSLPIKIGDKVTFDITVYNQGTVVADSITITDNIPAGFALMDATWTDVGGGVAEYFHLGPLATGDSITIPVMVEVLPGINTSNSTNQAEISEAFNENDEDYPDVDSVEDDDPNNDAGGDVNGDSDNQTDGNGTDDEDDADPATIPIFDLALAKKLANPQPKFVEGDTVKFDITIVNQGNMDATNIVVTDSLPCGLLFEPTQSIAAGWSNTGQVTMATLPDTLAPGETATITIYTLFDGAPFMLCTGAEADPYTNYSWIEDATDGDGNPVEDVDSQMGSNSEEENDVDPNMPGDNDVNSDGTDGNQDDHDPAGLMVFDLALTKMIDVSYNPGTYAYGDTVKFIIKAFSQGNLPASNIEITDYMPEGFNFIASPLNSIWTDNMDDTYATTITDTLGFSDTATVCIYAEIIASEATDAYINYSEISAAHDTENDQPGLDQDSTPDDDPTNDSGGEPNSDDDDYPYGAGGDFGEDEDDHDPAFLPIFDLALKKTLATAGPYAYGDTLTFDLTVYNQGNVPSTNIEVTDYINCGYTFDMAFNPDWTPAGVNAKTVITDTLATGDSAVVSIRLILQPCDTDGGFQNVGEISGSEDDMGNDTTDDDADSTADDTNGNDGDMEDDATGGENDDEDDSDFATPEVFDLAQIKEIVTAGPYMWGDTLQYAITVVNQGNVPATNIEITDNLPIGLTYSAALNPTWTGAAPIVVTTITDTLLLGDTAVVNLYLILTEAQGGAPSFTNISEISGSEDDMGNDTSDDDADSSPDDDPSDDEGGEPGGDSDNQFDGDGTDDEDDQDPALVEIFDLALTKTTSETGPFRYGDTITFDFNVYNQGTMPATNIEITEFTPCGYAFDASINSDWALVGGNPTTTITDTVGLADSVIVSINLIVQPCDTIGGYRNTGEISSATDDEGNTQEDIDSKPDNNPDNDGVMTDNENGNGNGDEDDSDFEEIEIYDLAQIKEIVTAGPYAWGDTLEYVITLVNQGNVSASNIVIADHVPAGLTFEAALNPDWTGAAPTVETLIEGSLNQGDTARVSIYMILTQTSGGADDFTNISEISGAEDEDGNDPTENDADSDSNGDATDDTGGEPNGDTDNQFDGDGTDDEDDHDPAIVEVFDLALTKTTTATGPFSYGDTITFDFTVYNQGNIPSTNIEITENTPCGYEFVPALNTDWASTSDSTATTVIQDTLQGGDSVIVSVNFIIEPCYEAVDDAWKNTGEISASEDDEGNDTTDDDIDSDADDDPSNDGDMEDGATDGTNGDEDDSDFELIEIVDLAQKKELVTAGPYAYGDTLTYAITVYNQGNVKSTNIELTDHVPAGLDFVAAINPTWSGTAPAVTTIVTDTLCTGDSAVVNIQLILQQAPGGADDFTNISEISGSEDNEGNDTTDDDIDSDADSDPTDDEGGEPNGDTDNQIDGDGTDDEDDQDPAIVEVFDLALDKTTTWTGPITYGDIIPFDINVSNQGNIAAYNVEVTEYIPCGYIFQPANNPLWTYDAATSTATAVIAGPVAPGATYPLAIDLGVQPCSGSPTTNWTNAAEISGSENEDGEDMSDEDIDSTTDNDPDNDGDVEDNDTNNTNGDEDDHDIEMPQIFDLALKKVIADGQATPVTIGQDVTMTIWVYNQGTIPAANVEIAEYLPAGLTLSTADTNGWTDSNADGTYENTITSTIAIGDSIPVDIVLTVQPGTTADDYTNVAEISGAEDDMGNDMTDEDIDSDTDDNPNNDNDVTPGDDDDNTTDGNGQDGADEDDSDPELVPVAYTDLALVKQLAPTQAQAAMPGGLVDYEIIVYNQGSTDAYNVNVIDYIPSGLIYSDAFGNNAATGWSDGDNDGNPDITIAGPLAGFTGTETVIITLQVDPNLAAPANLTNTAEITGSEDEDGNPQDDIDSTPDDMDGNEMGVNDNETEDAADEDDSDPAQLNIVDEPVFDLALAKTLDPSVETPLFVGDTVLYNIEVINQGTETVYNVEITDNMGACLDINGPIEPNGWVDSDNDGAYENVIAGPLAAGERDTIAMEAVIVCQPTTSADVTNIAEISAADDEDGNPIEDIDSTLDDDPTNDGPSEDNETEDPNDEDDHDPEVIPVSVFDLALTKKLSPTTPMPIMPGGDVHFVFEVCNQGTVAAYNVDVVDYPPAGLTLSINDAFGWTDTDMDGNYENTIASIPAGQCKDVTIILTIDPNASSPLINQGEISDAEDENGDHPQDTDSNPDDNPNNDAMGDNDQEDGDGTDDEDDHDWEEIQLGSWDLALVKTLAPGQSAYIAPGDDVTFAIEIINQGTMDAYNIDIAEYLPAGMTLSTADANGWTDVDMNGVLENTFAGPLAANAATTINLVVTIDPAFTGTSLENTAEISDFEDDMGNHPDDNDSTPDDDPNNDPFGDDNQEDGNGTDDEDDSDPEEVFISSGPVYDLALEKMLDPATVTPVYPGDDVTFIITVTNQGNTPVQNVEIVDYLPTDLTLSAADTNGWADSNMDGNPENTITGPMAAGEIVMIPIVVTIDSTFTGTSLENRAEISEMQDTTGMVVDDTDSNPDDTPGDDEAEDDEDGDEVLVSNFDLALVKTVAPGGAPSPIMPGDDVTFRIKVINQGNVAAYNVDIAEYIPAGMTLSTADMNGWTDSDMNGIYENTIAGPIVPGMYEFIDIILTIDPATVAPTSFENEAEISDAEDSNGNHPEDSDSTPDDDPDNDGDANDNNTDGEDGDEDDNDIEEINIFENMFDLALAKIVSPEFVGGAQIGEDVPFDIWVYNQGNVTATNIEITEYLPAGTALSNADTNNWVDNDNDGIYETTRTGPLVPGDSMLVEIILTVVTKPDPATFINAAEISGADDGNGDPITDIDSTPDGDNTNDDGGDPYGDSNNETDDDGDDTDGDGVEDEDDHDPEAFPIVDLAMTKTTAATGPFSYGDVITFDFTVYNQGNVTNTNIQVTEYTPCGFDFDASLNSAWTDNGDGTVVSNITTLLAPGDSTIVSIDLIVEPCYEEDGWKNSGEISGSEDDQGNDTSDEDIDSTTDNDPDNDGDMSDNGTDSSNGDEDDSDFERIEVFDLAQSKRLAPGQASTITVGSPVTFEMTIFNQGNTTAYDIELTDYIPSGLLFDPAANTASATGNQHNWTLVGGNATYGTIDSLTAQDEISVTITFTVDPDGSGGPITNYSEISNAAGTPGGPNADDADSSPDADENNDNGGTPNSNNDNNINGNGTNDEDDHDPAVIVTIAHYAKIVDPCNCLGNGLIADKVTIHSTKPNENWSLVVNTGMYTNTSTPSNLSSIPLGTTATFVGLEFGLYVYELPLIHLDGVGYTSTFSNGKDLLTVGNLCVCPSLNTNPDGTPAPGDTNPPLVFHGSKTPGESTLDHCDGVTFTSSIDEHKQYVDTAACTIMHTICPTDQWKQINFNFSEFDLAEGDYLLVYDGKDTRGNRIARWTGTGVSQTGGWISSHCSPAVNPSGCLTFVFETNGDNNKGLGWTAEITCEDRGVTLSAPDQHATLTCDETYKEFTIRPATIEADCGTVEGPQIVRVFNAHGDLCMETCLEANRRFREKLGLGTYTVEYKLKSDTVKQTRSIITVQEAPLVCNDKVNIPLGSNCSIFLTPDDLLEGPCDTITDSVYYFITLKGIDKNGNEAVLATGGGKGGNYPAISKEMIDQCGGTFTAEIEKRYYDGLNLNFCNNGPYGISCQTDVVVIDQTAPFFSDISSEPDTFRLCTADLTPENLGIPTPNALDNCTEAQVEFSSVNVITDGGACDTTRAQIIWTATDECGNTATASQTVVILRPEFSDIVMAPNTVLSCGEDGTEDLNNFDKTGVPSIKVGKVVNGVLQPTDTIALDTANYLCGYILQKTDVSVPADCGIKVFRNWNILDWCDAQSGPQALGTQFIELRDTLAPTFVDSVLATTKLDLPHDACTLDITTLDHPAATDNCSAVSVRMDSVFRIENGAYWGVKASDLTELDCDSFLVRWVAQDACHEQVLNDTITQLILIEDNNAPVAACVDKINLSLGQNEAKLHYKDIDGGSYDACGIVKYEVSRDEENWGETVIFNCDDAHQAATVYLRVTDAKGNQSTCWMTVNVEDKIAPICSDLPDMTGTCEEEHLADLGASTDTNENGLLDDEWVDMTEAQIELFNAQYGNPNCSDNIACGDLIVEQQYQLASKKCGQIAIQRRFRAIDWDGHGKTSNWSNQNINIESQAAWTITLPGDWKGTCGDDIPATDIFITNGNCDLLAHEVEEKVFTVTEDACLKVVRTFTIINWCNYEAGQPTIEITREENEHGIVKYPRIITAAEFENAGKLEYIQILKLQDDSAPVITIGNVDNCIESEDCIATKRFAITANDCNTAATIDLVYNWTISANGTQLTTGEGSFFNYDVAPNVNYEVNWTVADKCGNTAKETANYEFSDCKKPAPYCLNGSAVELMSTGMIQVWAKDFERGSTDNCTPADKLAYRIWHANLGDAPTDLSGVQALPEVITFDCATLGQQTVNFYAIDEAGNWDFCTTYIIIQDNMKACENTGVEGMAVVSGTIMDWKQKTVEEVMVRTTSDAEMMTTEDGFYNFELAMNNAYTIQPEKNNQPLNGVSTFDLVLISKHILGINKFDNPYQMIAADVNKSGSITAFDMVQIRQLILNIKTEFTNNESWRFVEAAYEFTTDQPLTESFPEVSAVDDLLHDMQIDFVAVKIGDVNGNAKANSFAQAEDRTTTSVFEITTTDQEVKAGQTYTVEFNTTQLNTIQGYQFTLGYEDLKLEKLNSGVAGVENFGLHKMDEGMVTTSWNQSAVGNEQPAVDSEQPSTVLFNIKFTALKDGKLSEQLNILNRPTAIEAYSEEGDLMDVQLTFTTPAADNFKLYQNQPNPFHDKTTIGFNLSEDSEIELILRDETGRVLKTIKQNGKAGYNTVQLEIGDLPNGFIYYQLSTKYKTKTKKMIQLK